MDDPGLAFRGDVKPAPCEHFQHGDVVRQNLRNQLLEPGLSCKGNEMAHQESADASALIFIYNGECQLGRFGPNKDVTSAADDDWSAAFLRHCNQRDVLGEVDIQEERDLLFRKIPFCTEEAAVKRLIAGVIDSCKKVGLVGRFQGTNFDPTAVGAVVPLLKMSPDSTSQAPYVDFRQ